MREKNIAKKLFKREVKEPVFHKLYVYVIIVNHGYGKQAMKLLRHCGSNAQYLCMGRGTADKEALQMLGIEDSRKDVVFGLLDETRIEDTKSQLEKHIPKNKEAFAFAFTLPIDSIVGEKVYHFLSNTL